MIKGRNVIEYDRVRKTYPHKSAPVPAIDDLSFAVGDREFASVLGPSGCGKTTLLKITAGIMPVSVSSGLPSSGGGSLDRSCFLRRSRSEARTRSRGKT